MSKAPDNSELQLEESPMIPFTLDGKEVMAFSYETIFQVSQRLDTQIPHLCYAEGLRADGNCRACVVEIEGERTLAPSCYRKPNEGMKVSTQSERTQKSQKMVLELLQSDAPDKTYKLDSELTLWSDKLNIKKSRFTSRAPVKEEINPRDILKYGLEEGQLISVESRRGSVTVEIRADSEVSTDVIFMPFCYYEGSANKLTNAALDPFAKIAETKYCAVRITDAKEPDEISSYGAGQALEAMSSK